MARLDPPAVSYKNWIDLPANAHRSILPPRLVPAGTLFYVDQISHAAGELMPPCSSVLAVVISLVAPGAAFGDGPVLTGEQIYRQKCASCHGASGEGTDDHYPRPLVGERPVASLARLIAKTMPEDAPGECVGEDAQRVAAYIYETFYSKDAQARNKFRLPRIELSRLTVRQYRNAVTDLIGSFRNSKSVERRARFEGRLLRQGKAQARRDRPGRLAQPS